MESDQRSDVFRLNTTGLNKHIVLVLFKFLEATQMEKEKAALADNDRTIFDSEFATYERFHVAIQSRLSDLPN